MASEGEVVEDVEIQEDEVSNKHYKFENKVYTFLHEKLKSFLPNPKNAIEFHRANLENIFIVSFFPLKLSFEKKTAPGRNIPDISVHINIYEFRALKLFVYLRNK